MHSYIAMVVVFMAKEPDYSFFPLSHSMVFIKSFFMNSVFILL